MPRSTLPAAVWSSTVSTSSGSTSIDSPVELVVALDGPHDGFAGGRAIEMVEPKVVREQIRDPPLEAVELGERIVAQRQQDTHAQAGPRDQLGQLEGETALRLVVEEVLLGLVEHQQQVAGERLRPPPERVGERLALPLVQKRGAELSGQSVSRRRSQAVGGSSLQLSKTTTANSG